MADYSNFPFDMYSITEVTQMFMDSIRVDDAEFAAACRKEIQRRPPSKKKTKNLNAKTEQE